MASLFACDLERAVLDSTNNQYIRDLQDARHPTDDGFEIRQQWSVLGIRVRSSTSSLSGYLGQYSVSVDITNVGVDPLSSLTIQVGTRRD